MAGRPIVHVFPGQGDFSAEPIVQAIRNNPVVKKAVAETFSAIDVVAVEYGIPALASAFLGPAPPTSTDLATGPPGTHQLALFGSQMAVHYALISIGWKPDRVLGISYGEISALTASGAFSLETGTRAALQAARCLLQQDGGMTLILASETRVKELLEQAQVEDTVIACVNHRREVIITSPDERELLCVEQVAADESVRSVRLPLPFCCHHPSLESAAKDLADFTRRRPTHAVHTPVFSAVHERAYVAGDDLHQRACDSLTHPFHLPQALVAASPDEPSVWLEMGTGTAITKVTNRMIPEDHTALSPLTDPSFTWEDAREESVA